MSPNGTISSYTLLCSSINNTLASTIILGIGASSFYAKVTNLTNSVDYTFQLAANNQYGTSPYVNFQPGQPGIIPGGPSNVTASTFNNNLSTATISWSFTQNPNEGINKYFVLNGIPSTSTASISSFAIGLYPNQSSVTLGYLSTMIYTFLVQSINDSGYSYPNASTQIYVGPDRHFNPPNMSTLGMWLDASTPSSMSFYSTTSSIKTWTDKSASGINYIQTLGSTYSPVYAYDSVYSTYGVYVPSQCGLNPSSLTVGPFSTTSNFTIFTVNRFSTNTGQINTVWENYNDTPVAASLAANSSNNLVVSYGSSTITASNAQAWNGIGCYISNTSNFSYYANGTILPSNDPNTVTTSTMSLSTNINIGMGNAIQGSTPNNSLLGWIYEVIVYQIALTQQDRQVVEGYLAWKWGLASQLPINHPYKTIYPYNTSPMEQNPTGITNISFSNITTSSFTVSWSGGVGAQIYSYSLNGILTAATIDNGYSSQNATFTGLSTSTNYTIIISGSSDRGSVISGSGFSPISSISSGILENWYDASDPHNGSYVSTGTNLTSWYDKSGKGNNGTLSSVTCSNGGSGANNNTIILSNDGYNYIQYNSAGYYINPITWAYNNAFTCFVVTTPLASASTISQQSPLFAYAPGSSGVAFRFQANAVISLEINSTLINGPSTANIYNYNIGLYTLIFTTSYKENVFMNGTTSTIASNTATAYISSNAANFLGFEAGYGASGTKTREILLYQGQLNITDQQKIEGYLAWKWGTQTYNLINLYGAQNYLMLMTDYTDRGLSPQTVTNYNGSFSQFSLGRQCALFNAPGSKSTYISMPFNYPNSFTISFWCNVPDTSNSSAVQLYNVYQGANLGGSKTGLSCNIYNGNVTFSALFVSGYIVAGSINPPNLQNCWHHYAIAVNNLTGTVQCYFDTILEITSTGNTGGIMYANYLIAGQACNVNMQYLAVHNTVLTQAQITNIYNATQNTLPQNHPYYSAPPNAVANITTQQYNLTTTLVTYNSISISWSQIIGATNYTYMLNGITVTPSVNNGMLNQTATFNSTNGITPNTTYTINVTAVIGTIESEVSSTLTVISGINPPSAITNLATSNLTTTGFTLTWSGGANASSYSYSLNGLVTVPSTDNGVANNTAIFSGLQPNYNYNVVVTAINSGGSTASGTFWLPNTISTLHNWFDANDVFNGASVAPISTNVSTLYDKALTGYYANVVSSYAILGSDANFNYINFSTTYYSMNPMTWMLYSTFSLFIVTSPGNTSLSTNGSLLGNINAGTTSPAGNGIRFTFASTTTLSVGLGDNYRSNSNYYWINNQNYLFSFINSGTLQICYVNGQAYISTSGTQMTNNAPYDIGTDYNASGNIGFTGKIREMIFYKGALSTANQQIVEGYLAWKWGFQCINGLALFNPQNLFYFISDYVDHGSSPVTEFNSASYPNTLYQGKICTTLAVAGGGYVQIPFFRNSSFTVVFWQVTSTGQVSTGTVASMYTGATLSGTKVMDLTVGPTGTFNLTTLFSTTSSFFSFTPSTNTWLYWNQYALTVNLSTNVVSAYINGVYQNSAPGSGQLLSTNYFYLQCQPTTTYIQTTQTYNYVLTQPQLTTLYNSQLTNLPSTHPAYSTFSQNTSFPVTTTSGFQPTSITSVVTTTSITISWSGATGAVKYIYYLNGSITSPLFDNGLATQSALFTGLLPGTVYNFVITAINIYGAKIASNTYSTNTSPAITNVVQTNTTTTGFALSWQGTLGFATSFTYSVNGVAITSGTSPISLIDNGVASQSVIFTGMTTGTKYQVNITAIYSGGTASYGANSLLNVWYDGSDPLFTGTPPSNGATVATWLDKSGQAYNASSTGSNTYNATNKSIYFSGSNGYYIMPNGCVPYGNTAYSIFIVANFNYNSGAAQQNILAQFGAGSSGGRVIYSVGFQATTTSYYLGTDWFTTVDKSSTPISNGTSFIFGTSWSPTSTNRIVYQNGVNVASSTASSRNGANTPNNIGYGTVYNQLCGYISEIIVFNTELAQSDRQRIEGYLAWKWSLQTSLPVSHPYYSVSPGIVGPLFTGTTN